MKKLLAISALFMASTAFATSLNVVGSWSNLDLHKKFEVPYWTEALPKASNGDFTVNMTSLDQMGIKGGDVFNYLRQGMFDVGMTVADYTVSDAPELEGLDIPMIANTPEEAEKVANAFMPVAEAAAQKRFNSHVLAIVPYPQQVLFCKTPISGLDDLKGKKVRASGRSTGEFLEAIGAESINLAFNEVPGGLERGVIDCAVTGSMSGYSSKWYEVSKYLYPIPVGGWDYVITMISDAKWNSLSDQEKQTINDSIQTDFLKPVWANAVTETEQGVACLTGNAKCNSGESADMTLVPLKETDLTEARKVVEDSVLPQWTARVDASVVSAWNDGVGKVVGLTAKK